MTATLTTRTRLPWRSDSRRSPRGVPSPKQGFSLHELLVVMGAITLLIPLSLGWIHRTLTAYRELDQWSRDQRAMMRFSTDLRADLRQAQRSEWQSPASEDSPLLTLALESDGQHRVDYFHNAAGLLRVEHDPSRPPRYEQYPLRDRYRMTVSEGRSVGQIIVELWSHGSSGATSVAGDRQEMRLEGWTPAPSP